MGFFGKTDPAEDAIENAPTSADTEKQVPSEEENWAGQPQAAVVQVDPAVEKRVLRKLDLRLPILMAFLCECHEFCSFARDSDLTLK